MPRGSGRQAARAENLSRDLKPTGELLGELHIYAEFLISRWQHCRVGRSQSVHRQRLACVAMQCQTPSRKLKLLAPHARRRKCCAHRKTMFAPAVTCRRGPTHSVGEGPECTARGRRVALHSSARPRVALPNGGFRLSISLIGIAACMLRHYSNSGMCRPSTMP